MARRRNKGEERQVVRRRIAVLLGRARAESLGPDAGLADRYGALSIALAKRYQSPLEPDQKAQVCRKCHTYRRPGTSRVRVHRHRIVTTCLRCGHVHRRPAKEMP